MTNEVSRSDLLRVLAEHRIAPGPVVERVSHESEDDSARALLRGLVAARALTPYQAECLLHGQVDLIDLGAYLILDRLGSGAMGTVYRALHRRMNRVTAIKMMTSETARKPGFSERFDREVQTLAQLRHDNIVIAYDAGECGGRPYLAMEFVDGRDLATEVVEGGPLSTSDAVDVVIQAASGLGYAHRRGLVHRDVKPANLLRDAGGTVKVADLGIARVRDMGDTVVDHAITQAGDFIGSAAYAAPEQAIDATAVDARADIYALGCTFYFLLTGRPPYVNKSLMSLLLMHRDAAIPDVRADRPDAPAEAASLIARMLAKDPDDRFASMDDVIRALQTLRAGGKLSFDRPRRAARGPHGDRSSAGLDPASDFEDRIRPSAELETVAETPASARAPTTAPSLGHSTTERGDARRLARISVVLVEPSRLQSRVARGFLEALGITRIRSTDSGREAIAWVDEEGPDIVVSAMHLRDMSGAELVRELAGRPGVAKVGFVLTSTDGEPGQADSVADLPRAHLLPKPYRMEDLAETLDKALAAG
ncbi:MAG: protein kinase [Isosphaeraceae bacterium]|nr:protein kinase [Isosphaeraceae bacterium]